MRGLLALLLVFTAVRPASGQADWEGIREWSRSQKAATRAELQDSLARLEQAQRSSENSEERSVNRVKVETIRTRLGEGDFEIGDGILLDVRGETQLSDTFTVASGRAIELPVIGRIPLAGVLLSELEPHLTTELGRYLRDPVVKAQRLIRLSIVGAVDEPGFHLLPPEKPLADVLMQNGLTQEAELAKLRVERGREAVHQGDALHAAVLQGSSLEQLGLRTGDVIRVTGGEGRSALATLGIAITTAVAVTTATVLISR